MGFGVCGCIMCTDTYVCTTCVNMVILYIQLHNGDGWDLGIQMGCGIKGYPQGSRWVLFDTQNGPILGPKDAHLISR